MKTDGRNLVQKRTEALVDRPVSGARLDRVTPPVRVPAIPANRAYLRALREAVSAGVKVAGKRRFESGEG